MIRFSLYSRSYCHLCEDMLHALKAMDEERRFVIEVIDVDADEALLAQFDELVPVLFGHRPDGQAIRLCHYFLDEAGVRAFLAQI